VETDVEGRPMVPSRRARVGVEEVGAITAINPNAASPPVDDTTREAGVPDASSL
jgi:hypothetical protein